MLPENYERLLPVLKKTHPELDEDELLEMAEKYSDLAKLLLKLWLQNIDTSSRDPPG